MNALVAEAQELEFEQFDLTPAFLRERFADWTLVHFAISADVSTLGLKHRPVDLLCGTGDFAVPTHIQALALWLRHGQAAQEMENALTKARGMLRNAKTDEKKERAERQLAALLKDEVQVQRDTLRAQAQAAWAACEAAAVAARWQVNARYPEGFARKEGSSRWKYIHAARTARRQDAAGPRVRSGY